MSLVTTIKVAFGPGPALLRQVGAEQNRGQQSQPAALLNQATLGGINACLPAQSTWYSYHLRAAHLLAGDMQLFLCSGNVYTPQSD
jgi:hypothetical protein